MEQNLHNLKCNVTISVPINVVAELDALVNKDISRNKIVNEAIINWLQKQHKIQF